MIKTIIWSLAALLFAACTADDAVTEAQSEEQIRNALKLQKAAWNEGDIEGFVSWYLPSDELRFTTSSGMLKGADELLERYRASYADRARMGRLDFEILEFKCIDEDHAVTIGKWTVFRESDRPEGYFTLIWKRTPEGWRIAIDHTS